MTNKRLCISAMCVLISGFVSAQQGGNRDAHPPAMEWHKGHGTDGGDHVHYGMQTRDGGYIMIGEASLRESGSDMLVVKTDAKGDLEWQKVIGESRSAEYGTFVTEIADGFIAAGALTSGDLEGNNAGEYINLTRDGGYVVFTDSDTVGSMGENNFGLMKIAPDPPNP